MIRSLLIGLLLSGCQLIGPEEGAHIDDKTFPSASDFPVIQLEEVENQSVAPGEYNINVFVVHRNECPGDGCQIPDGIAVASKVRIDFSEDYWRHIPLRQPGQFELTRPYLFSVTLSEEVRPEGTRVRYLRLIGYD